MYSSCKYFRPVKPHLHEKEFSLYPGYSLFEVIHLNQSFCIGMRGKIHSWFYSSTKQSATVATCAFAKNTHGNVQSSKYCKAFRLLVFLIVYLVSILTSSEYLNADCWVIVSKVLILQEWLYLCFFLIIGFAPKKLVSIFGSIHSKQGCPLQAYSNGLVLQAYTSGYEWQIHFFICNSSLLVAHWCTCTLVVTCFQWTILHLTLCSWVCSVGVPCIDACLCL